MSQTPTGDLKQGRTKNAAAILLATVMAAIMVFALAFASTSASAAPLTGTQTGSATDVETPSPTVGEATPTATVSATPTRRPIKLRPRVQFGHAPRGENERYHLLLFNHVTEATSVNMDADSFQWHVAVSPTVAVALPGYANVIDAVVHVPISPTRPIDVARVRGVTDTAQPYTTTAWLITVTRRHPFGDLDENHWADGPVQFLYDRGVVGGYGDGSFRPNDFVTRAQFAKMLVGAMGWPLATPPSPTFSDVPADFWAYAYIETAYAHGVIGGYGDGSFRPAAPVTRAQVAKMVYLAGGWTLGPAAETINFTDVQAGDWYYTYAMAAGAAEIMGGYGDGSFRPGVPATRAQVAKILAISLYSDPNN